MNVKGYIQLILENIATDMRIKTEEAEYVLILPGKGKSPFLLKSSLTEGPRARARGKGAAYAVCSVLVGKGAGKDRVLKLPWQQSASDPSHKCGRGLREGCWAPAHVTGILIHACL